MIPPVPPCLFTWWNGGALNASLVKYSDRDGVALISAPQQENAINMEYWISCQVGERQLFQVQHYTKECRIVKLVDDSTDE